MSDGMSDNGGYVCCGPDMEPCHDCKKLKWTSTITVNDKRVEICEDCLKIRDAKAFNLIVPLTQEEAERMLRVFKNPTITSITVDGDNVRITVVPPRAAEMLTVDSSVVYEEKTKPNL